MPESNARIDLHQILVEIEDEVRAKRASGELPADLERELDLVFARYAPPGAIEGDFDALLERAEQQAFIDLLAPNESVRPGVPQIKRVVQKAVRWYMRYVVQQFSGFAHTITRSVRILGGRVTDLEQLMAPADDSAAALRSGSDIAGKWQSQIVEAMSGAVGRVLHARCSSGELVTALKAAGVDAYGVDSTSDAVAVGTATGLDLRPDDEREHLRTLAPGALGGLVLTGSVDYLPRGAQIELIELAAVNLIKGGVLVVATTHPSTWAGSANPVQTDLAPGRPLHTETWRHLLSERGFSSIDVSEGERSGALIPVPGTDEASAAMNANIHELNQRLFLPVSSLIVARR